jgi:hypothetical protein
MQLDLSECGLDVISVKDNICAQRVGSQHVDGGKDGFLDPPKEAGLLGAMGCGFHHVDGNGGWSVMPGPIKYFPVWLNQPFEDVLGGKGSGATANITVKQTADCGRVSCGSGHLPT